MKKLSLALMLVLFSVSFVLAQRTIRGTVTDETGEPLIGASVLVKGTNSGTATDIDGTYSVNVPEGAEILVFSYTGYESQEVAIGVSDVVDVVMAEGVTLEAAVVTALGVERDEKAVGYAVQEVEGTELLKSNETNLVQSLSGKVAGLQVTASTGTAGASSFFVIRGPATINGNNQPLIVVDGVPIDNSQLRSGGGGGVASVAFSNRAVDINPSEIESVSVLKGAAATALYGSLAGNGAIIITTKRGKSGAQKISVDFSSRLRISEFNKVPELQNEYAQGLFGGYAGPETGSGYSWGPRVDTLSYTTDQDYLNATWGPDVTRFYGETGIGHDVNGAIVSANDPLANGQSVNTYDPYSFFRTALASENNLAISASNEYSSLRFSVGYLDEEGIVPNNDFQRLNLGLNADTKLGDRVSLGIGVQYVNSGGTRIEQGSNVSGVMLGLTRTAPTFDNSAGQDDISEENNGAYTYPDGTQRKYRYGNTGYDNPYWTAYNNPLRDQVNRFLGNLNFRWDITDWMNLSWRPGFDVYTDFRRQYFAIGSRTLTGGQVFEDTYRSSRINHDLLLNVNRDLTDWLGASVTIGHHMRDFRLSQTYLQTDGLQIPGFYSVTGGSSFFGAASEGFQRVQSVYGMLEFDVNDYLFLTGTYRVDQDNSLPEANNTFGYYSASASFVFSELLPTSSAFSFGKLRASYGRVGLGTFAYSTDTYFQAADLGDGWTNGIAFPAFGTGGFTQDNLRGNPALEPEFQTSWEVGVDLRFFNNRVGLDFTYYNSLSENIILTVPVAGSSGFTSTIENAASISNKGIEAVLNVTPVRSRDFRWDMTFNYTRNRNLVESLAEGVDNVFLGGFVGSSTRAEVGVPYGTIFGNGFYRDADGNRVIGPDGFPLLDPNERGFGSALPDYTLGIRNTFSWKGLQLSALLDIKQGGVLWNGTRGALYFWGTHQATADLRYTDQVFDGHAAATDSEGNVIFEDHDGDATTPEIPVTTGVNEQSVFVDENWLAFGNGNGFFGANTEDFVEDASWIRLRDVSLSYSLPASLLENTPISGLQLSLSGRNLWLDTPFTGVDPETNLLGAANAQGLEYFNMPNTKSYVIGLNVSF
jgi:TonB-linked SusC/RagA family outer membrane protein